MKEIKWYMKPFVYPFLLLLLFIIVFIYIITGNTRELMHGMKEELNRLARET